MDDDTPFVWSDFRECTKNKNPEEVLYNLEYTPPLIIRRAKNRRDGLYAAAYIRENTVLLKKKRKRLPL